MKWPVVVCLFMCALVSTLAPAESPDLPPADQARYQALINELRCVICQNRSIAESDAPLANDMRAIVARQIREGQTDAQIKTYLADRYGEFVLYHPRFNRTTWLLWLTPPALLLIGIFIALLLWRRGARRANSETPPDAGRIAQLINDDSK